MSLDFDTVKNELEQLPTTSDLVSKISAILELDAVFTGLATTGKAKNLLPDAQVLQDIHITLKASVSSLASRVTDSDRTLEEAYLLLDLYNRCLASKRDLENYLDLLYPFKEKNFIKELSNVELEAKNTTNNLKILASMED